VYLKIRPKAAHLRELGISHRAIGRALGVTDKSIGLRNQRQAPGDERELLEEN
jgi:hypothetical protein